MSTAARDVYLRNAVLTATPEQLQLMLYDGAIRFATQGRDAIDAGNPEAIYSCFSRAQKIILEMQAGLRPEVNPSLCKQMSALYDFIYRKLVDASIHHDATAADDALRILNYQRETWVMLMARLREETTQADAPSPAPARVPPSACAEGVGTTLSIEG